jgi:hypothetical protein
MGRLRTRMDEQLLTILKLCLLALLYLFFFRVLRAVWTEIRGPKLATAGAAGQQRRSRREARAAAPARSAAPAPAQLAVVEPAELRGRTYPLGDEVTVGRAAGCGVTLDDTFASSIHARVFSRDGQLFVEDLGSTNGTYLNRRKVQGPQVMRRGDRLQVGNTVLELV